MAAFQLYVGKKYDSYDSAMQDIAQYEKDNYVNFVKSDSTTIERAKKLIPNKNIKPEIKYNTFTLVCYHGGKKHKPKNSKDICSNGL